MQERWAVRVKRELESLGWVIDKDDINGYWQCREGDKVFARAKAMGDVLRTMGNSLEIL